LLDGGDVVTEVCRVPRFSARRGAPSVPVRQVVAEARHLWLCTGSRTPDTVRSTSDRARTQDRQGEDPVRTPTTVEEMGAC
jgi:hypothetical protein